MRNIFIFLTIFIFIGCGDDGQPSDVADYVKSYHKNGKLKMELPVDKNGKPHGISKSYDEDGELVMKMIAEHGSPVETIIYLNGKILEHKKYTGCKFSGDIDKPCYEIAYFLDGTIRYEGIANEKDEFIYKEYYDNGILARNIEKTLEQKTDTEFFKNGNKMLEKITSKDLYKETHWYDNKNLQSELIKQGASTEDKNYYLNGNLMSIKKTENEVIILDELYEEDGKIHKRCDKFFCIEYNKSEMIEKFYSDEWQCFDYEKNNEILCYFTKDRYQIAGTIFYKTNFDELGNFLRKNNGEIYFTDIAKRVKEVSVLKYVNAYYGYENRDYLSENKFEDGKIKEINVYDSRNRSFSNFKKDKEKAKTKFDENEQIIYKQQDWVDDEKMFELINMLFPVASSSRGCYYNGANGGLSNYTCSLEDNVVNCKVYDIWGNLRADLNFSNFDFEKPVKESIFYEFDIFPKAKSVDDYCYFMQDTSMIKANKSNTQYNLENIRFVPTKCEFYDDEYTCTSIRYKTPNSNDWRMGLTSLSHGGDKVLNYEWGGYFSMKDEFKYSDRYKRYETKKVTFTKIGDYEDNKIQKILGNNNKTMKANKKINENDIVVSFQKIFNDIKAYYDTHKELADSLDKMTNFKFSYTGYTMNGNLLGSILTNGKDCFEVVTAEYDGLIMVINFGKDYEEKICKQIYKDESINSFLSQGEFYESLNGPAWQFNF
ncbi:MULTISPECIES: hypothetical protein [unclassified Campylobacter]|uniref:hypothetical protein n=1 Tax=unclassified Campylobacter TaxID=2593542 RepID=UPI0022EA09EB|nr:MULTISPECIES: hypothetical protein [unclassified Campylobacter]MDA3042889.1 hypothetical protein [Campylobacter sp. JMF_09 ED2]MDA3044276.1 hypothetical protein [Campylobacter sp. JMF_07 ED4]MDA3063625.1 hypothetical protein [Campylobacter sp. JMF_11 EL3]MDA3071251.1 hypothetical protein [Campylobacter sp. VBCF_03 NA9]MDA3074711.1 hypothetical protein [Campylobacter sp. JMF_05 ED3]